MEGISRKATFIRKPPKDIYPSEVENDSGPSASSVLPSSLIHPLPKSPIDTLRFSNPNLQPLSDNQENEILKSQYRHSYHATVPTPPPSSHSLSSVTKNISSRHSIGSVADIKSKLAMKKQPSRSRSDGKSSQTFWKYHILELGEQLYLTTNPDSKHLYCRNAPGIHVEIIFPKNAKGARDQSGMRGFQLVFRDQIDYEVFMTVTKKPNRNGDGSICIESLQKFYEEEDGTICSKETETIEGQFIVAKEIDIPELKHRHYEQTSVNLCRFEAKDSNGVSWNIGSVPQFKSTTKLKNKRFIYFHRPGSNRYLGCFRPHEQRVKKKLIKKLKSSTTNYLTQDSFDGSAEETVVFSDSNEVFYDPGDGVFIQNPPDDSPSDVKLGWITIYDDVQELKTPGLWEIIIGYTLAIGIDGILNEKLQVVS